MRIGIDFGTTHTSAAYLVGDNLHFLSLDAHNPDPHILRSMIYIDRAHRHQLGLDAIHTFLAEDTGRPVVYADKMVGTIEYTVDSLDTEGAVTIIQDVGIDEDVGANGRLLQSIKTGLRFPSYKGTKIFDRYYTIEELIALILAHVRSGAEKALQTEIRSAVLGRPVKFSDDAADDRLAEARLRQAAKKAGFDDVIFMAEPVAAAYFYLAQAPQPQTVFVFDFGGGTLDLTVMRAAAGQKPQMLAAQGVLIGGDDLDSALMRTWVAPYFGARSRIDVSYDGRDIYFDEQMIEHLYRWQTIPLLSREEPLALIERAIRYGEHPQAFRQLACLVSKNYGFPLFEQIEQSKRLLSTEPGAVVTMKVEKIDLAVEITRPQFNQAINEEISTIRTAIRQVVQAAAISPEEIDVVLTTGGSSAIPIFRDLLMRTFPAAKFVQSDLFGSVTGGLAMYAASLNTGRGLMRA
jgi:hypothetical chaperone protein